jgi:hypothetical protein
MHSLGDAPSFLHAGDPDAVAMAQGGYWITDFHSVFAGGAVFRAGRWKPTRVDVHELGTIRVDPGGRVGISEFDADEEAEVFLARRPPPATHPVFAAVHGDRTLCVLIRLGDAPVTGWTPALLEGQSVPRPPWVPMLQVRTKRFGVGFGRGDGSRFTAPRHGVSFGGGQNLVIDTEDGGDHQVWWGLDAAGAMAALVVDVSGGLLREFERRQPTAEDSRHVASSCPRIVNDEAALVRRLEHLRTTELIAIDPDVELSQIAKAFFAQPDGNLRRWLVDAPQVAEVFYSD